MKISNQIQSEILPERAIFIPKWPLNKLVDRNCPLCEYRKETLFLRSDNLPVAYCDNCEIWFVNKIPDEEVIYETYEKYYKTIRPEKFDSLLANKIKNNAKRIVKFPSDDTRVMRLLSTVGKFKEKKILEIGCGTGEFLYYLSALGADVIGCELSKEACEFITSHLFLKAYCGNINEYTEQIGRVDIVILNDVVEHFTDLNKVLKVISNLINKDGILLIWTPNGDNAGKTLESAKKWIGFSIDLEHLQYFSSKAISKIAESFNFEIIHLESLGQPCLNKIKAFKPSAFKQKTSEIRFNISAFLNNFTVVRVIKRALGLKNNATGDYVLFAILRKK